MASAIDWRRAAVAAAAARLAYRDGAALADGARAVGFDVLRVTADPASGADAVLLFATGDPEGAAFLAVRGTERDYRDILADLDIRKARLRAGDLAGRVHGGFLRQARAVIDDMAPSLRALRAGGVPVVACGHSLGGAVALLVAARLALPEVWSFGAPRVGDRAFARGLAAWRETFDGARQVHRRVARAGDVVPHLPLLGLGFRHDAPALWFDGADRFLGRAPLWRQWAALVWRALTGRWTRGPVLGLPVPAAPFTDHRVAEYVRAVAMRAADMEAGTR